MVVSKLMRNRGLWKYSKPLLVAALLTIGSAGSVFAQSSSSDSYQVTETQFSSGSTLESCSGSYCARATIGDGGGFASSPNNSASFGSVTPDEPMLEVIVNPGESNLGVLSTEETATKTTTIQIRNYLSDGYTLQITGDPPTYSTHSLATPSTPTASDPGTEQFGINAVANTAPSVGANPAQVPSGDFSFGSVLANYATPNLFMYNSGDVIARSTTSSGRTDYTISMIINVSNSTPAGKFNGEYAAVVIPIY